MAKTQTSASMQELAIPSLKIYDTTLRDGLGTVGLSLSAREKIRIVQLLDQMGVTYIEAGFPDSNPKEEEFFELLAKQELENSTIAVFGMTRRKNNQAENDDGLQTLVKSFAPITTLVGKSWSLQLEEVLRVTRRENQRMIEDSIMYCRQHEKRVFFDAEHFFDSYLDDPYYALDCLQTAVSAGAENITLCDTNGGTLPQNIAAIVKEVRAEIDQRISLGIHAHDDSGCAVANSLNAVQAGADLVQGTINGYGERCGNANLMTIIPALQLKMGAKILTNEQLASLRDVSFITDEIANQPFNHRQPYVGRDAFTHKAGMHSSALARDSRSFEHVNPEAVGNSQTIVVSEMTGTAAIAQKMQQFGVDADNAKRGKALQELKRKEHEGYHYEAASASLELLLRKETGHYQFLFELESFKVIIEKRGVQSAQTEAILKILIGGQRKVQIAEGNGPVDALNKALRAAIEEYYPQLQSIELTNYKVRILDEDHGTAAKTRVLLDSADDNEEWGSIGVSENIVDASWQALLDSLEYKLQK